MSGRKTLAAALKAAGSWQVVSDPRVLDSVQRRGALVLAGSKRQKAPALGLGWFTEEMVLWVLTGADNPAVIEDDLDDLLLAVLAVLEPLEAFHWDTAERGVLADSFDGYRLTVTAAVQLVATPEPEPEDNNEEN